MTQFLHASNRFRHSHKGQAVRSGKYLLSPNFGRSMGLAHEATLSSNVSANLRKAFLL